MIKRTVRKSQIDKYGRILCAALLAVYFVFALTQSNAFKGEMFNALKVEHEKMIVFTKVGRNLLISGLNM